MASPLPRCYLSDCEVYDAYLSETTCNDEDIGIYFYYLIEVS